MLCYNFQKFYKSIVGHALIINCVCKNYIHCSSSLLGQDEKPKSEAKGKGENIKNCLFIPKQKGLKKKTRKVTLIGAAGRVGLALAHNLTISNYCDEMVMVDLPEKKDKLSGNYLDLIHCNPIRKGPKIKMCTDGTKSKDSDLLIISAGIPRKKGQSRRDLVGINAELFKNMIPKYTKLSPNSVLLIISNPTDILSYLAWKYSGFPKNRIISTGTELDSARFRYHISKRLGINPRSVHGWIVGEHGDSSVPVWSSVNVAGTCLREIDPLIGTADDRNQWSTLHKQTLTDGGMVVGLKGRTEWAISFTAEHIAKAVLNNSHTVHAVSTQIKGMYGVQTDLFLSFPCIIGNRGVQSIIKLCLEDDEIKNLNKSACILEETFKTIKP